jgi:hypothetical protein
MKRVALIGSSGGNLHRLGGADPGQLIGAVHEQLGRAGIELAAVCFVAVGASLDSASQDVHGALWRIDGDAARAAALGSLKEINPQAQAEDEAIAQAIDHGEVDGIIVISADPAGINHASIAAAARQGLPAVGSGGSSVAAAQSMGVRFVAATGTTGTTSQTRAIGYAAGLARTWKLHYSAVDWPRTPGEWWERYDPRPAMDDALPAIFAIAAVIGVCRHIPGATPRQIVSVLLPLIPVSLAFTAAVRTNCVGPAGLLAGLLAGVLAAPGGVLAALVAGFAAATLANVLVSMALRYEWPSTSASILGGGAAGLVAGGAARILLEHAGRVVDDAVRTAISTSLDHAGLAVGIVLGLLMWPIILKGIYHSFVLPLMVFEFAAHGLSFLAAMDTVTLVAVSAGLSLAAVLVPRRADDRQPARQTLTINLLFGTFVEGSYPYFKSHRAYLALAALAAAAGGAVVGVAHGYGVSYIPVFTLPVVGSAWRGLTLALLIAFGASTIGAVTLNAWFRRADAAHQRTGLDRALPLDQVRP